MKANYRVYFSFEKQDRYLDFSLIKRIGHGRNDDINYLAEQEIIKNNYPIEKCIIKKIEKINVS
jgi:hypothetical protein